MMSLSQRINRLLTTRIGERVLVPAYGSNLYLLRDRKVSLKNRLLFAKYCKDAIEKWENVKVTKVEVLGGNAQEGTFNFSIVLSNNQTITGAV